MDEEDLEYGHNEAQANWDSCLHELAIRLWNHSSELRGKVFCEYAETICKLNLDATWKEGFDCLLGRFKKDLETYCMEDGAGQAYLALDSLDLQEFMKEVYG